MRAAAVPADALAAPRPRVELAWPPLLSALATAAVVVGVGVADGGFRPATWRLATAALCALAAAALALRPSIELGRRELVMLVALAGYGCWSAVSTVWSIEPGRSTLEAERTLLYVAAVTLVLVAVERTSVLSVVTGLLAGITCVAAIGIGEHYLTTRPLDPVEGRLLIEPLGYSNALGLYAGIGVVLALGVALAPLARPARAAALSSCAVLVPTLLLTSSRGGAAATAVGVVAMLYLGGRVRSRRLLVALALVGVALGIAAGTERHQSLSIVGENRPHYWHVALDEYAAHPLLGSGAGTFGDYFWRAHRPRSGFAREAHSLYLETLGELGPVGLALLAVALATPLVRLRSRGSPLVAAAAGGYVAFLAHAAVDWDWKIPALTIVALLCGGVVLVGTRAGPRAPTLTARAQNALLVLVVLTAALAVVRLLTGPGLGG